VESVAPLSKEMFIVILSVSVDFVKMAAAYFLQVAFIIFNKGCVHIVCIKVNPVETRCNPLDGGLFLSQMQRPSCLGIYQL
jgi:hypothetical protein